MDFLNRFTSIRNFSRKIVEPLSAEDCVIQSMPDASPIRWHLAHTTWFFEMFLLKPTSDYEVFDNDFEYLFNSYYNTVGEPFPRSKRGLITRPGMAHTLEYRRHVDNAVARLLSDGLSGQQKAILEIGLNHEQQHQELMLTDIKHVLSCNPTYPVYISGKSKNSSDVAKSTMQENLKRTDRSWIEVSGGLVFIGHQSTGFCFDNEQPPHREFLEDFRLAKRTVSNGEYIEFIEDGGYATPSLWLAMGLGFVKDQNWKAPLYWEKRDGAWHHFTLSGLKKVALDEPVCHVSLFEADAFARWSGYRLPTESEWEYAAQTNMVHTKRSIDSPEYHFSDRLLESDLSVYPQANFDNPEDKSLVDIIGNVWEWTSSQYTAYPGYKSLDGALGEYNGKFMCNQFVLRGGSCATPSAHIRTTYRNFFPPETRWQFSGIRLAD